MAVNNQFKVFHCIIITTFALQSSVHSEVHYSFVSRQPRTHVGCTLQMQFTTAFVVTIVNPIPEQLQARIRIKGQQRQFRAQLNPNHNEPKLQFKTLSACCLIAFAQRKEEGFLCVWICGAQEKGFAVYKSRFSSYLGPYGMAWQHRREDAQREWSEINHNSLCFVFFVQHFLWNGSGTL